MKNSIPTCRTCHAPIIWMKTKNGKNMPVDWDARFIADTEFSIPAGHVSHFSTCEFADQHRSSKIHSTKNEKPLMNKLREIPDKHHDGELNKQMQQETAKEMYNDFGLTPMRRKK